MVGAFQGHKMTMQFNTPRSAQKPSVEGYQIGEHIDGGGMGDVWHAIQRGTNRTVAIKFINESAVSSPDAVARFRNEVKAVARLKHPGIAQVYESPIEDDILYYAMEFVDGGPIDKHVAQSVPAIEERVRLICEVADAVQHAHLHGVIHRDLKPSNVLVRKDGSPVLVDFGAAKLFVRDEEYAKGLTQPGQDVGTLRYMSPEQASGETDRVDVRTDVYALGVLLYELLAGRLPYEGENIDSDFRLRNAIVQGERIPIRKTAPSVPKAVEAVIDKAIKRNPAERYQAAGAFRDDLERALRGEPVHARKLTLPYLFSNWCNRQKRRLGLALLSSIVIALIAYWGENWIQGERESGQEAEMILTIQGAARAIENGHPEEAVSQLNALGSGSSEDWLIEHLLLKADASVHTIPCESVRAVTVVGNRVVLVEEDGRVRHIHLASGRQLADTRHALPFDIRRCAITSNGNRLAVADGGNLFIVDLHSGQVSGPVTGLPGTIRDIAWSPNHDRIALLNEHGQVNVYGVTGPDITPLLQRRLPNQPNGIAFDPESKTLTCVGNRVVMLDVDTGEVYDRETVQIDPLTAVSYSEKHDALVVGNQKGGLSVWAIEQGELALSRQLDGCRSRVTVCGRVQHGGDLVTFASTVRGNIVVWREDDKKPSIVLHGHTGPVRFLADAGDKRHLVSATKSELKVWDLRQVPAIEIRGQGADHQILAGAISPAGDVVAVSYVNQQVDIIAVNSGKTVQQFETEDFVATIRFSNDGNSIATALADGRLALYERGEDSSIWNIQAADTQVDQLRFNEDNRFIAATANGRVMVFSMSGGQLVFNDVGHSLAWFTSNEGERLLVARPGNQGAPAELAIVDVDAKSELHTLTLSGNRVYGIAANATGTKAAVILDQTLVQVIDIADDGMTSRFVTKSGPIAQALAFAQDGNYLFTAGDGVRVRTTTTGREVIDIAAEQPEIFATIRLTNNDRLLGTLGDNRFVVWRRR